MRMALRRQFCVCWRRRRERLAMWSGFLCRRIDGLAPRTDSMKRLQRIALANAILFLMAGCLAPLHAADRVYLRSGSDLVCDHQKNLNGQVRLYLTPSDDNYLDVAADDILSRE